MKKIGLLATAIFVSSTVFAQQADSKNEHRVTVNTTAKSETTAGKNKGEIVSSTASVNSNASVKPLKPHTSDKAEIKREAAENRAEAKAELAATVASQKEVLDARREDVKRTKEETKAELSERKDDAKARAKAKIDAAENGALNVDSKADATVNKAKKVRVGGSASSDAKVQLRRKNVTGKIGTITRLHL